jgi:hypothetical protein
MKIVWLCEKCGRYADKREDVGDESCYLNATRVYEDSIILDEQGRVKAAKFADREPVI